MIEFDDMKTDTVKTSENSINQIAELVSNNQTITCSRIEIKTSDGTIEIRPAVTELEICEVEE